MATPSAEPLKSAANGVIQRLKRLELSANAKDEEGFRKMCETVKGSPPGKGTALHYAAVKGKTEICQCFIENVKVNANLKSGKGDTALFLAVVSEHLPTATYLIKHGADANLKGYRGITPLHYAAEKGLLKFMELLISSGAEIDTIYDFGTPLQAAASKGHKEAVRFLLDHNASPNIVSPMSRSPLLLSIMENSIECMEMLLQAGADPNICSSGKTPLADAALEVETDFMKLLLKAGADPNVSDLIGMTPLERAALELSLEGVMLLLPVTSRNPTIPDWSLSGIINHVRSKEAKMQRERKRKENFLLAKTRGDASMQGKDYLNAIICYTKALFLYPDDVEVLLSRSSCWGLLNDGALAVIDAQDVVRLRPNWAEAHYRLGETWKLMKNYRVATVAFSEALSLEPENKKILEAKEAAETGFGLETPVKLVFRSMIRSEYFISPISLRPLWTLFLKVDVSITGCFV